MRDEHGEEALEYVMIAAVIIFPLFVAVRTLAQALRFTYWLGALVIDSPFM